MDFFSIKITKLPDGYTADQLEHYLRVNINSFVDNGKASFTPYQWYGVNDINLWNSQNPYSAVISIDIGGPDNVSVVVSKLANNGWTFTTIQDPYNGTHPVSGNREFGYISETDGAYTFYTRGVDRLTDWEAQLAQSVTGISFDSADALWNSFQNKVKDFVNSHGGIATLNNYTNDSSPNSQNHNYINNQYQYFRPKWQDVLDVINRIKPLSSFSTDCPD